MDARLDVRVVGFVQGREIDAPAAVSLDGDSLRLGWHDAAPWYLALDGLDGVGGDADHLSLYLGTGDVIDLRGPDGLRPLAAQLVARACAMPEVTRGLRHLGTTRTRFRREHDQWFAPLIEGRRRVEGVSDPLRQGALLDAGTLGRELLDTLEAIAAVRAPDDAAMRRAWAATLEDETEAVFAALERMGLAADALQGSALDSRLADWRRWVDAVRGVYAAADAGWPAIERTLEAGV